MLLNGYLPFDAGSDQETARNILSTSRFSFPSKRGRDISENAKQFVQLLLYGDQESRPTAAEALEHPWLQSARPFRLSDVIGPNLFDYLGQSELKKAARGIISSNLKSDDAMIIQERLEKSNKIRDGKIRIDDLNELLQDFPSSMVLKLKSAMRTNTGDTIDYTDLVAATMSRDVFIQDSYIKVAFDEFDENGDGVITLDDLTKSMGSPLIARNIIDEMGNAQGLISLKRFAYIMRNKTASSEINPFKHETPRGVLKKVLSFHKKDRLTPTEEKRFFNSPVCKTRLLQ